MKKLLLFVLMLLPMAASADDSGKCGENVYYTYNAETHTLTIYGTGEMESYRYYEELGDIDTNIPWYSHVSEILSINIEYGITSIGEYAFINCYGLTSIIIPNSVTSIGGWAFWGCSGLTSVTIPSSVTCIGFGAFQDCSNLTSITIPNSVSVIEGQAFHSCVRLTSIMIPNSVTNIGAGAFYGTAWYNNQPDGLVYAGKIAYIYKGEMPANTHVSIKEGTIGIALYAFQGCSGLTSVTIPNSVKYIASGNFGGAFRNCSGLTSVSIGNGVTSIEKQTFESCSSLTSITIPNSVTSIGNSAFSGCSGLTSVIIPNSVTSIGEYAFYGCSSLSSVVSEIGKPYVISNSVFKGTPSDAQLIVPKGTKAAYQATEGWNHFTNIVEAGGIEDVFEVNGLYYKIGENNTVAVTEGNTNFSGDVVIPSQVIYEGKTYSVTSIGVMAFDGCSGLTSITIPESVKSIGDEAFNHCSGLTSITIPESVEGIGWRAFYGCGLTSITILGSPWIEEAFNGCPLTSVHISDLDKFLRIEYERPWEFNDPLNWAHHLFLNGEEIKDVVIPSTITKINDGALSGASSLTSVTIPNSVTSIGGLAFAGCSSLSSVVSEIENPYVISNTVFDGIPSDAKLIVPKGTKAAYQATEGWNQFTNIVEAGETEPDQPGQIHINDIIYKVIGSGEAEVVSADNGVISITIPSTVSYNNTSYKVTAIAKDAFENCEHLAAVIWEPEVQFNAKVNNPNLLLYVNDDKYASRSVKNVVVDGIAENIELTDAASGNDFYCPRAFRARSIVYSHNYQMETGIGDSRGWETIVLPFDVQKYTHATKGELESFTTWSKGSNKKPFWLFELTASGYKDVAGIKANTPYIISMPNNKQYEQQYQIPGIVTFSAENVEVQKSDNLTPASYQTRKFVPNYANKEGDDLLPLNVSNNYVTNPGKEINGSKFIRGLRAVHPFEAYMTTTDNTRTIDVIEGLSTAIKDIRIVENEASVIKVYDTRGILLKTVICMDDARAGLKAGVYIVNGKKMIIK